LVDSKRKDETLEMSQKVVTKKGDTKKDCAPREGVSASEKGERDPVNQHPFPGDVLRKCPKAGHERARISSLKRRTCDQPKDHHPLGPQTSRREKKGQSEVLVVAGGTVPFLQKSIKAKEKKKRHQLALGKISRANSVENGAR